MPMTLQHSCRCWRDSLSTPGTPPEVTDARADGTGYILVGRAGGLRARAARQLGTFGPILAEADLKTDFGDLIGPHTGARTLAGAALVIVTEPFVPGITTRFRYRHRARTLVARYSSLVRSASDVGVERLIVCSSAFLYSDDGGRPLLPSSPLEPAAETVAAHAAERAAHLFTNLGGQSVVLRFGWVFDDDDPITARVVATAQKGWQLIEGRAGSWVPAISSADVTKALCAASTASPGTYQVSDGRPITQGAVVALLEEASGRVLHPLHDPSWGEAGTLFGASRLLSDAPDTQLAGWRPAGPALGQHLFERVRRRGSRLWRVRDLSDEIRPLGREPHSED